MRPLPRGAQHRPTRCPAGPCLPCPHRDPGPLRLPPGASRATSTPTSGSPARRRTRRSPGCVTAPCVPRACPAPSDWPLGRVPLPHPPHVCGVQRACPSVPQSGYNVGIVNVGAPAAGMNAAVRSAVRVGISDGHKMFAIYDGFEGFARGQVGPRGGARREGVPAGSAQGSGAGRAMRGAPIGGHSGPRPSDGHDCLREPSQGTGRARRRPHLPDGKAGPSAEP